MASFRTLFVGIAVGISDPVQVYPLASTGLAEAFHAKVLEVTAGIAADPHIIDAPVLTAEVGHAESVTVTADFAGLITQRMSPPSYVLDKLKTSLPALMLTGGGEPGSVVFQKLEFDPDAKNCEGPTYFPCPACYPQETVTMGFATALCNSDHLCDVYFSYAVANADCQKIKPDGKCDNMFDPPDLDDLDFISNLNGTRDADCWWCPYNCGVGQYMVCYCSPTELSRSQVLSIESGLIKYIHDKFASMPAGSRSLHNESLVEV